MHYSTLTICIFTAAVFVIGTFVGSWVTAGKKNAQLKRRADTLRAQAQTVVYLKRELDSYEFKPQKEETECHSSSPS